MVNEIEKLLQPEYWKFEKCTDEETAIIVDSMSTVRKVDFRKTVSKTCSSAFGTLL